MKQKIRIFLAAAALLVAATAGAQRKQGPLTEEYVDTCVEVSLLTCSPHEEIYSLYGHSALLVSDRNTGRRLVYNYGVFSFKKPYFVLRFVLGKTDYELGVMGFNDFCKYYRQWGSQVTEQVLNLTPHEKMAVIAALYINAQPENCTYRYNFFYDNCSTRPRDIVERNIDGTVIYAEDAGGDGPTYREMIHQQTRHHPWAACGNDLLLGVRADQKTNLRQQEFLPENLRRNFSRARIYYNNGEERPLVKEERVVVAPGVQTVEKEFPLRPRECAWLLLLLSVALVAVEWRRGRTLRWWDALLMTAQGLAGVLIVVMFFSEHPATSTNLQVLLLNPLPLAFLPAVVRGRPTRWWRWLCVLTALFFLGALWQDYAEGMMIVALCLLSRAASNLYIGKR